MNFVEEKIKEVLTSFETELPISRKDVAKMARYFITETAKEILNAGTHVLMVEKCDDLISQAGGK